MAEIPVHKKSNLTWLWILLALLIAALLVWWVASDDGDEIDPATTAQVEETTDPATPIEAEAGTIAAILANPDAYLGEGFTGEVSVGETMTDRGFWIESDGSRMFALIVDEPREVPLDINPGQELSISGGTIRETSSLTDVEGETLDADTRKIADEQKVILVVDEANIEIVSPS